MLWLKDRSKTKENEVEICHSYPRDPGNYRAPSWSWAAVDGAVVFTSYDEERTFSANDATIIRRTVETEGVMKFGVALSGSLILRGMSKSAVAAIMGQETQEKATKSLDVQRG